MENLHEFRAILTSCCNYRCFFCHREGLSQQTVLLQLCPEDYRFVAVTAMELWGWSTMTLTGGEPLCSPNFAETTKQIAESGVKLTVVTNGSLLSNPQSQLEHIAQVNVSLHTLNSEKYQAITKTDILPQDIVSTIQKIRQQLPEIEIHLNVTVLRQYNDDPLTMSQIINFAHTVGAKAKFIDLVSENTELIVPVEKIQETLIQLGFTVVDQNLWQIFLRRADEQVIITRCGFSESHRNLEPRNLLLRPDGVVALGDNQDSTINVLAEIKSRNRLGFARKIADFFTPLHPST